MKLLSLLTIAFVPVALAQTAKAPDYEMFRTKVQPIFAKKREGQAKCIHCHTRGTAFRLAARASEDADWNEEQSRQNYEAALRLIVPGDPDSSRLLVHPLAPEGGGDPFHGGGKKFFNKRDPDWQVMAAWVKTGAEAADTVKAAQVLDFDAYRKLVEPVLLNPRGGGGAEAGGVGCFSCHTTIITRLRLAPLSEGATTWTEAQSRKNFEAVARLVIPGQPLKSPLILKPLATDQGGAQNHSGGKFFRTLDDPELKVLMDFVNSKRR